MKKETVKSRFSVSWHLPKGDSEALANGGFIMKKELTHTEQILPDYRAVEASNPVVAPQSRSSRGTQASGR